MRVVFWHSSKDHEVEIANALIAGVNDSGDRGRAVLKSDGIDFDTDVAVMIGVKSIVQWKEAKAAGLRTIMVDRGYCRSPRLWRVSVDHHNPTQYVATARHGTERIGVFKHRPQNWKPGGETILIAGSSAKYHEWYGLKDDPNSYCEAIAKVAHEAGFRCVYCPKWAWEGRRPIKHASYDVKRHSIRGALLRARVLVTHGSNSCLDALLFGKPSIVLGDGVTRSISSTSMDDLANPRLPTEAERTQLLSNLAWCQFSIPEMASGLAWRHLRKWMDESPVLRQ